MSCDAVFMRVARTCAPSSFAHYQLHIVVHSISVISAASDRHQTSTNSSWHYILPARMLTDHHM
jgi:hypothetical protein